MMTANTGSAIFAHSRTVEPNLWDDGAKLLGREQGHCAKSVSINTAFTGQMTSLILSQTSMLSEV
jgi:hypothetical protein